MRFGSLISLMSLVASVFAGQFIVELKPETDIDAFVAKLSEKGATKVIRKWTSRILYGVVIDTQSQNIDTLSAYPEVVNAWPNQIYTIPDCSKGPC